MDNWNNPVAEDIVLNVSRANVLTTHLPPVREGIPTSKGVTKTKYRMRWGHLQEWDTFETDAVNYFNNVVTGDDAAALVFAAEAVNYLKSVVRDEVVRTEPDIKRCVHQYV